MNSHAERDQFDIKHEEDPLSFIEIKIEPEDIKTEAEECDDKRQCLIPQPSEERKSEIKVEEYNSFGHPVDIKHENETNITFIKTISEVDGTQESLEKILEDFEKKSQDENKIAGEDVTNVDAAVYNLGETYGTDFQEQKCDDYAEEKANICSSNNNEDTQYNVVSSKSSMYTQIADRCFKCNICNRLFTYKSKLFSHMFCHSEEKPFKCDICNKSFTQKSYLKDHKHNHTNEKPFKCNICNKSFIRKSYLTAHTRSHTNEKPFKCNICNKSFTQKSYLKEHIRTHTNEKPFNCKICNRSFSFKSNLTIHILNHN